MARISRTRVAPASTRVAPPRQREVSPDSALAAEIKRLMAHGEREAARERFADLVGRQQRRAVRIAYQYLHDAHDADEAVQDAFLKVFTHITSYREELPFEVWFTRILVNGCLDLRKARARRLRWVLPLDASPGMAPEAVASAQSVEEALVTRERMEKIAAIVDQLPDRQRMVFILRHFGEQTIERLTNHRSIGRREHHRHSFRVQAAHRRQIESALR